MQFILEAWHDFMHSILPIYTYLVWAGDMIMSAVLFHPRHLPNTPVVVLIDVASNHSQ